MKGYENMGNTCRVRPELVPEYIREDFALTLLRGFLKSIREHPERVDEYNRLGREFLERQEKKAREEAAT